MEAQILEILTAIRDFIWGLPLIVLLVGTGIFLTIRLRGLQIRGLFYSLYLALFKRKEDDEQEGDISHFQALMTALAATVGTGNIVGVAHRNLHRRPWSSLLDVDYWHLWDGHKIL